MPNPEFSLISDIIAGHAGSRRSDVRVGIGDDAAVLLGADNGQDLVGTMDTLVAGRHFFADVDPWTLGHKSLAVNLSDLAAMGATSAWAFLSLALPEKAPAALNVDWPVGWLQAFMAGMDALARDHALAIVGGDTVASDAIQISITALGWVPAGQAVLRQGARAGDRIWVSGTLGDAAAALRVLYAEKGSMQPLPVIWTDEEWHWLEQRLLQPVPRLVVGQRLRKLGLVHAMLDISDGLLADLGHLLAASDAFARIEVQALPLSAPMRRLQAVWPALVRELALSGGDDYELCFAAPASAEPGILALAGQCGVSLTCIGQILGSGDRLGRGDPLAEARHRVELWDANARLPIPDRFGYEHFATP